MLTLQGLYKVTGFERTEKPLDTRSPQVEFKIISLPKKVTPTLEKQKSHS